MKWMLLRLSWLVAFRSYVNKENGTQGEGSKQMSSYTYFYNPKTRKSEYIFP